MGVDAEKLLSDKRVVAEIERHLWLESERVGHDIGFENAKAEWLKNFSAAWMQYHMPNGSSGKKAADNAPNGKAKSSPKTTVKRRRAKSYL